MLVRPWRSSMTVCHIFRMTRLGQSLVSTDLPCFLLRDSTLLCLQGCDLNEFQGRLRSSYFWWVDWFLGIIMIVPRLCHVIHPSWTPRSWTRMNFSRQTEWFYHQIAVGRGKFGDRYKYSKKMRRCNPNCKFGCNVIRSVHHFFRSIHIIKFIPPPPHKIIPPSFPARSARKILASINP